MKKIEIFDPARCCPTGLCGPNINPDLMRIAAAVEYLGAEVPGPECEAGMLGRFMEEVLTLSPMPDKLLPRLLRKLSGPYRNRWRLREVLRTPVWRYYYDTVRGQWNEKFTVFR